METSDRNFFEHYTTPSQGGEPKLVRIFCCPCCGYPTLAEPAAYEICDICDWEDDGGEGYGPNGCSLDEARDHFTQYLTCYGPTHEFSPAALEARRRRIADLQRYMAEPDLHRRGELWNAATRT